MNSRTAKEGFQTSKPNTIIGLLSTSSCLALAVVAGCASTESGGGDNEVSYFRKREARPTASIFSPLDLPTPNSVRSAAGAPGEDYWQQRADYVIKANLDTETGAVTAKETVTYTNNSPDPLKFIWIQLEQNIFRKDSLGSLTRPNASIAMNDSTTDGAVLESLTSSGSDLEYHVYDTLARIDLDTPIEPNGGTFEFDVAWHFNIPKRAFRRFGMEKVKQGTIYEIAQWFPAMAVYDDVHGWNTLPYMGSGEFYTNFGDYDVEITVPRSHIMAATGVLQNPEDVFTQTQLNRIAEARQSDDTVVIRTADEVKDPASRPAGDGPLTWHFKANDVRTFAWASSDAFIYDGCNLDGVFVQSVYPKEATPNWEQSTQMLRTSINGYNNRWFKYPYPEATNVNGPEGGMEYPMLIFCGSRKSERGLYGVTTHEIGHNWFPMTVNTDERRHAWMDEGFNTFINYYSTAEWFEGEKGRRGSAGGFAGGMTRPNQAPIMTHADKLPRFSLGMTQYAKTSVGLVLLREQVLGPERFDAAFREYIRRWAFKSPRPADFFRTMENVAGDDLAWFWRGWFMETDNLDQAVETVEQTQDEKTGQWVVTVPIFNLEDLVMPVTMKVTYEDASTEKVKLPVEIWYPSDRFEQTWRSDKKVDKVEIDPENVFPDIDRSNNIAYPAWNNYERRKQQRAREKEQQQRRGRRPGE